MFAVYRVYTVYTSSSKMCIYYCKLLRIAHRLACFSLTCILCKKIKYCCLYATVELLLVFKHFFILLEGNPYPHPMRPLLARPYINLPFSIHSTGKSFPSPTCKVIKTTLKNFHPM